MTPPPLNPGRARRAALLAAAGFAILPWLQIPPVDFERGAALFAFAPALLVGAGLVQRAWLRFAASPSRRWFAGLAGLWLALSTAFAAQPAPALVQFAMILLLALLALLVAGLAAEAPETRPTLWAGLLLGALSGVASIAWAWSINPAPREARPELLTWLYPHLRHIGLHLLPATLIAPLFAARASSAGRRSLWLLMAAVLFTAIIWAGGRMPLLALAVGAGTAWLGSPRGKPRRDVLLAFGAATLAGLAASTLFWTTQGNLGWWRAMDTLVAADNLNELSSSRLDIWRACLPFIADAPLLGHGPDGYRFLMPKMDGQQPHNVVVQVVLACGLPGLLLLMFGAFALLRRPPSPDISPDTLAARVLVVGLLAGGLFDGTLYHVLSTTGLALGAGLLLARRSTVSRTDAPLSQVCRAAPALAACAAALTLSLHLIVFRTLISPGVPATPDAWQARLVHAFPSTTVSLHRWLDVWADEHPDEALAWARWAQTRSAYAWTFHAWAAQHLAATDRMDEARLEATAFQKTQPQAFRKQLNNAHTK